MFTYVLILTTMELFKSEKRRPRKGQRSYKVESLNSSKGIFSSLKVKSNGKCVVCLCLPAKTIKTLFPSEPSALLQMSKYRQLYKERKSKTL